MSVSTLALLVGFFSIVIITFIIFTIYSYFSKKVQQNSILYKNLIKLNEKYDVIFNKNIKEKIDYNKICNSKREFENSDLIKVLKINIENEIDNLINLISKIDHNKITNKNYLNEYQKLYVETSKDIIKKSKVPYKIFIALENKLYLKNQFQPILDIEVLVTKRYTSPAGRNSYHGNISFNFDEFKSWVEKVKKEIEYRTTQEYQRKIERAKVTVSLRWQILELDNHKCRVCNASSNDGVKLHVDHIIPISKGGTSDISNLQTLCETCNLGKSDRI